MPSPTPSPYLADRLTRLEESIYADADKQMTGFLRAYREANDEIVDELARLHAKFGTAEGLSLSEMHKYQRLDKLNKQLVEIGQSLGKSEEAFVRNLLGDVWTASGAGLGELLGVEFAKVPKARLEEVMKYPWSGANFSDRIWENKQLLVKNLRETLVRGMVQGQSFTQMAKTVQDVMGVAASNARRLVRTETMFFINQSNIEHYQQLGVKTLQYLAVDDRRTCDICSPDDEKLFRLGDQPIVPRHANCRCTYAPVLEDYKPQPKVKADLGTEEEWQAAQRAFINNPWSLRQAAEYGSREENRLAAVMEARYYAAPNNEAPLYRGLKSEYWNQGFGLGVGDEYTARWLESFSDDLATAGSFAGKGDETTRIILEMVESKSLRLTRNKAEREYLSGGVFEVVEVRVEVMPSPQGDMLPTTVIRVRQKAEKLVPYED